MRTDKETGRRREGEKERERRRRKDGNRERPVEKKIIFYDFAKST